MKMEKSYEIIQKIKNSTDIVDIIGIHVQSLQKSGNNTYKCLCPFHTEKTPSFNIDQENQYYKCFGCGEGGDVFNFLEKFNNWNFGEALHYLAEKAGINLPNKSARAEKGQDTKEKSMINANELLTDLFSHILLNTTQGKVALDYLIQRGFTKEIIQKFRLGYSLSDREGVINFLKSHNYEYEMMEQANLIKKQYSSPDKYEAVFRNRIMFPICDAKGNTVGFSGRALGDEVPKYLNSAKTPIFNKKTILYNYFQVAGYAKREKKIIIFEGFADVIAAASAEVLNGVAIMGTSLSAEHVGLIKKLVQEVIICFDGDDAGLLATYKAGELLTGYNLTVRVAIIPHKYDPDDYIKHVGKVDFKENIIAGAVSFMQFKMLYFRKNINLANESEKIAYIEKVLAEIGKLNSEIEKSVYCQQIAREFNIAPETINSYLMRTTTGASIKNKYYYNNKGTVNRQKIQHNRQTFSDRVVLKPAYYYSEEALLLYMIIKPEFSKQILDDHGSNFFNEEIHNQLFAEIIKYFARGGFPNVDIFSYYLLDQKLRAVILNSRVKHAQLDLTPPEINDHIYQVLKKGKEEELKRKKLELSKAEKAGNKELSYKLSTEILQIKLNAEQNINR